MNELRALPPAVVSPPQAPWWRSASTILLVALVVLATSCRWAQLGYDAAQTGFSPGEHSLSPSNVGTLRARWSQHLLSEADRSSGPIVVGGNVYTGARAAGWFPGQLSVFDAVTGSGKWMKYGGTTAAVNRDVAPAIADGVLYDSGVWDLEAVDLSTHATLWTAAGISPIDLAIDGSALLVTTNDRLISIDRADGRILWSATIALGRARPAIAGGVIYAMDTTDGHPTLRAYREVSGDLLASRPTAADEGVVVTGATVLLFGSDGATALDIATGGTRWHLPENRVRGDEAAVAGGLLYLTSAEPTAAAVVGVTAVDTASGSIRWTAAFPVDATSKPAVAGGVVYVGGSDSRLYVLDAGTGHLIASAATSGPVGSSPAVSNGMVYVADDSSTLTAFGLPARDPELVVTPGLWDIGAQIVLQRIDAPTYTVTNWGSSPADVSMSLGGPDGGDLEISADGCSGHRLAPGASCEVDVLFTPRMLGPRNMEVVAHTDGESFSAHLDAFGAWQR
jgi:outer membrane protein assembly factor BamB